MANSESERPLCLRRLIINDTIVDYCVLPAGHEGECSSSWNEASYREAATREYVPRAERKQAKIRLDKPNV